MIGMFSDIIWPLSAGFLLGLFFFGGLWLTVRHCLDRPHAGVWFSLSFLLRVVVSCSGIYLVGAASPLHLLLCGAGFLIARFVMTNPRTQRKVYAYKS